MPSQVFESQSEADTARLAGKLADSLPDPAVVALDGPLGAGKTRFVQALAEALGVPLAEVTSPTFTLLHEYAGRRPIRHLDAYRIRDDDEFLELGVDELFAAPGITLVEWAQRVQRCLPVDCLHVYIDPTGRNSRRILLRSDSASYAAALRAVGSLATR